MVENKPLHWMVNELFKIVHEKGLTMIKLEEMIVEKFGIEKRISHNTLKFWRYGQSVPKVSEVEMIAEVLGYEIDLILIKDGRK